jgi:hypothetical protein
MEDSNPPRAPLSGDYFACATGSPTELPGSGSDSSALTMWPVAECGVAHPAA